MVDPVSRYFSEGVTGSGKIRRFKHGLVSEECRSDLEKFGVK